MKAARLMKVGNDDTLQKAQSHEQRTVDDSEVEGSSATKSGKRPK